MDLNELKTLQRWFSCEVFEKSRTKEVSLIDLVRETKKFTRDRRLRVYSYGIEARLCDVLKIDFPYLSEILKKDMTEISRDYFSKYPPVSVSLDQLGKNFPRFLAESAWLKERPLLVELARLEWLMAETHFVDGIQKPSRTLLQDIKPTDLERATLLTNPSAQIFESKFNLDSHLFATNDTQANGSHIYIAYNDGDSSLVEKVSSTEAVLWRLLAQRKPLHEVCDELSKVLTDEEDPQIIMQSLQRWIGVGLIYGIIVS